MKVKDVLIIEGTVNLIIVAGKLFVGLLTGSTAIIADACHSITDVFNNVIAYWATSVSQQPADTGHPYGHRKFEQLAVFGLASFLVFLAFELVLTAIERSGSFVSQSRLGLIIMLATLAINIMLSLWQMYWAKKLSSDILKADASHTFSDVLTTAAVIAGWQFAAAGYLWLDTLVTFVVAVIIWSLAFKLFKRAIPILVDESYHDNSAIRDLVLAIPEVKRISRIRSRCDGSEVTADLVVEVSAQLNTEQSHRVADVIEAKLYKEMNISEVLVHIEPYGDSKS